MKIEEAAEILAMKPHREVREVVEVDDGHAALTHDGRWSSIVDGKFVGLYPVGYTPVAKPAVKPAPKKG